ncbi:MAG: MarR family winged helix-turn-helix transcriptional regulator [Acidimicrobiales bacterium]
MTQDQGNEVPAGTVRTLARAARMLERACEQMSLAQYRMLAAVASGDEQASRLALLLALSRPSVTAVVDALVERGWLVRLPVPGDRRTMRISVTPSGLEALVVAEQQMGERLRAVLGRAEDPAGVLAGLAGLGEALEAAAAERVVVCKQPPPKVRT